MWLKYPILSVLFLAFILLQVSFLPHFSIMGVTPNLVFILFFTIIFVESAKHHFSSMEYYLILFMVGFAGFLLDIFSSVYLGLSIFLLLGIYALVKAVTHFIREVQEQYLIFYFMIIFSVCLCIYTVLIRSALYSYRFSPHMYIEIGYNVILGCIAFYLYKKIDHIANRGKQLRLF